MGTKASGIKVTYRNIRELKPYKKNAKKHPKEQVERIMNSIKQFGFLNIGQWLLTKMIMWWKVMEDEEII
ncbi:hypothetical protein CS266P3_00062 [Clostridium phage CS266P3]|nr:hypothetical protein CS266P3_00062 [Clostridium phage CS266P3]